LLVILGLTCDALPRVGFSLCGSAGVPYPYFSLVKRHPETFLSSLPAYQYNEACFIKKSTCVNLLLLGELDIVVEDVKQLLKRFLFLSCSAAIRDLRQLPLELSQKVNYYWLEK
jgi:hypothetical protein